MRWRVLVPLVSVVAVSAGAVVAVDWPRSSAKPTPTAAAPVPQRAALLSPLPASAPVPRAAVMAVVRSALKIFPAAEQVSGSIVDVASGRTLWSHDADTPEAPASTLKLLTAAAALRTLGSGFRFTTSVRRHGNTIFLVGGGDPTLAETASPKDAPVSYPRPATLSDLATRTASALPPGRPVRLRIDVSAWTGPRLAPGWSDDYINEGDVTSPSPLELDGGRLRPGDFDSPRTPDPAGQAAAAFATLLHKAGVTIRGPAKVQSAPTGAAPLAAVSSPALPALVQRMLTDSDNDLAEALGRAVAAKEGRPPTFAGAAMAVSSAARAFGVGRAELVLNDASGLSHDDKVAPVALISILEAAARPAAGLAPILEGLPVAGFTGTLSDRYRGKDRLPGAGLVRAKTGSLTGVNGLAGLAVDASGRLLAFALLGSGTTETDTVQDGLDAIASGLTQLS